MARPQIITRERVAEAALRLLDNEGLEALSLERIASEMGVRGPSLYHHFSDKAEILTEVARLVLGKLEVEVEEDDWKEWMIQVSLLFYRRVMEHPNAATILLEFLPDSSSVPGFGHGARVLSAAGVDPSIQLLLIEGGEKLVWGWALQRALMVVHGHDRMASSLLSHRWPDLAVALRDSRWRDDGLFEASLRAFIDGTLEYTRSPPVG